MRKYIEHFDKGMVNLDNPKTYQHLPNTIEKLNERMLREIGYSTCYMDYWHPDVFLKEKEFINTDDFTEEELASGYPDNTINAGYYQRQRVYKLIDNFTKNRENNWKNILWFKEQVFLLEDEIENMC